MTTSTATDSLMTVLLKQLAVREPVHNNVLGFHISDDVLFTVLFTVITTLFVSVSTFILTNWYINRREIRKEDKRLSDRLAYFLWMIDYLEHLIPAQIKEYNRMKDILKQHKNQDFPISQSLAISPGFFDIVHESAFFQILVNKRVGSSKERLEKFSLVYVYLDNVREIRENNVSDFRRFESLYSSEMKQLEACAAVIQSIHDDITKLATGAASQSFRNYYLAFNQIIQNIDITQLSFDEAISKFVLPLQEIAISNIKEEGAFKLFRASREAGGRASYLIWLMDAFAGELEHSIAVLEEAKTIRSSVNWLLNLPVGK
jgi:hypothetical protein